MSFYTENRKYQRLLCESPHSPKTHNQERYMYQVLQGETFDCLLSDLDDFVMDLSKLSVDKFVNHPSVNKGYVALISEIRRRYYLLDLPFEDLENEKAGKE